jgi:LysM repeat protein
MSLRLRIFGLFLCSFTFFSSFSMGAGIYELDSLGVERVGDKSFILHRVEPKETLFGISRRYSSPVGDIIGANEVLKQGLKIGQTIRIPFTPKSELPVGSILHKVVPGETLFSISKSYGLTVEQVKQSNKLIGNDLSIGQSLVIENATQTIPNSQVATPQASTVSETVSIPKSESVSTPTITQKPTSTPREEVAKPKLEKTEPAKSETSKASTPTLPTSQPMVPGEFMTHQVQTGETLFAIATQYGVKVEDLIRLNALTSNNLRTGQNLKVGRGPIEESKVPVIGTPRVVSSAEEMNLEKLSENPVGYKNIRETGQAERIEGTGGHKKYLVLHRTAPVGTIMRIKNEENDITIFARVVGTLPETGDHSKLVIKLSQAAFDQLKAVNSRFPVEILY